MRSVVPKPIPTVDDPMALEAYKPRYRGRLHQVAFFVSIPAAIALFVSADSRDARVACAIYGFSVVGLFFTSSLYNRLSGTPGMRSWMRWLDHSMIYVLIAGSYTPVCWLALSRSWSVPVLGVVWSGALAGVALKMTRLRRLRRLGGFLYLTIGWFALVALPKLIPSLTTPSTVFLFAGGIAYMVGAVFLWLRRPNPTLDFGYHEVWHGFVVLGAGCHFAMTWLTVSAFA